VVLSKAQDTPSWRGT